MARLLTLLLLYKAGYSVGKYISLERIIEEQREGYYEALNRSSINWHEGTHTLIPWLEYFLGIMLLGAYREFEHRAGLITTARGAKRTMILEAIERLPQTFQYSDIDRTCPGISRPTINRALRELREKGKITCIKSGRDAQWQKT